MHMYWKQQQGYGKAEALLEEKWPERYNVFGHTSWGGRLYGKGLTLNLGALRSRVYQGVWGSAPFQSLYQSVPTTLTSLPLMPEWYLLLLPLLVLSLLGLAWDPLLYVVPVLMMAVILPVLQAVLSARRARFTSKPASRWQRYKLFWVTAFMHLQQPLARLIGRLRHGLSPWRRRGADVKSNPFPSTTSVWREDWIDPPEMLGRLQGALAESGATMTVGSCFDKWDIQVRGGLFGNVKVLMAVEEHGGGKQLYRFRIRPSVPAPVLAVCCLFFAVAVWAGLDGALGVALIAGLCAVVIAARAVSDVASAAGILTTGLRRIDA